jgi:hypothetical protein
VVYFLLLLTVGLISFILIRNSGAKKLFNVPWYYRVISLDIGKVKGKFYTYKRINGAPDAVFKHLLLPSYIVGELKGRRLADTRVRGYEFNQITLYIGLLNHRYIGFISGKLAYKDQVIAVKFNKGLFKTMVNKRDEAIAILNRLQ